MNVLVTAGNTLTPIDKVRGITNIFTGRTGARIAATAAGRGHAVTLLTSHPEHARRADAATSVKVKTYRTFDDLHALMETEVRSGGYAAVIHSAAVSDYRTAGVFAPSPAGLVDVSAGKVKSHYAELWLKLEPTPKLIDFVREPWCFAGVLVKFKLEVGAIDDELLQIAEASRRHSRADLMAANTYEGMNSFAYVGPINGEYRRVSRIKLADTILDAVEAIGG